MPARVITPHRSGRLALGQLWRSRELIGLFVWRDFVAVYAERCSILRGTSFGRW
jgi:hypothetical protein